MSIPIHLRPGDKLLIAGQNGSGKSVLARSIANAFRRVLVYDPKGEEAAFMPNATVATTARDAIRALPGRVVYVPVRADMADIEARFDEVLAKVLTIPGGHGIVIHELADLTTAQRIGPVLSEVIRKGRSLGITLVMVTQRPQGISVFARSEAQHVVSFTLTAPSDRDVLGDLFGAARGAPIRLRPLPLDHRFWYRGPDLAVHLCEPLAMGERKADASITAAPGP